MTTLRTATGLVAASLLLLGSAAGCGDDTNDAGPPAAGTSPGTTSTAPAPGTTTGPDTGTTPRPAPTETVGTTPDRPAPARPCGTVGDAPPYRVRARGVSCSTARDVQRAWYPAVMAGREPLGYRCKTGPLAATDIPQSVRCRRGTRLVTWSIADRTPAPEPDRADAPGPPSGERTPSVADVPQLARRCGDAAAFDAVSFAGSGGCRAAKDVADAFETQYAQGGSGRVTTLLTRMMDYRCVRGSGQFSASNAYIRFTCTATRPGDASAAGVPTKVRFHQFGDL